MLLLIIFLPLIGSILSGFLGFYIGSKGSVCISIFNIFFSFFFSSFFLYSSTINEYQEYLTLFSWIHSGNFYCNWGFLLDSLTSIMLVVVTGISLLVHIYSSEYMSTDPHLSRFMSYLSLFTFFMLILVTADNFVQMFVGWEGVGFCSYLLINFWFTRLQANKAAIKAMVVNRISDFALILGIFTIYCSFKSIEYSTVFAIVPILKDYYFYFLNNEYFLMDLIGILLFIGAMGKSAQIFLHTWLPDAMEGPTPVSALIHAATMVTAGVYLVSRCSPILEYSTTTLNIITIVGASTAFFASTVAVFQNDVKKIIAYSTCSQLGYMFMACGLSNYALAIFHLSNHSVFKALLFLGSGSLIHSMSNEQDIRKMGGLRRLLPFTYISFLIGSLSLMGFPFLTGFYSKDAILENAFASYTLYGFFAYWLGTFAAALTSFYSVRLIYKVFLSETNAYKSVISKAHDAPLLIFIPLAILAIGSIFLGYLTKDMFIGLGTNFWGNSLFVLPQHLQSIDAEFIPVFFKLLPIILSLCSSAFAIYIYHFQYSYFYNLKMSRNGILFYNFFNKKWYFDKIYQEFISQNILKFGYNYSYKLIDKGIFELIGPKGISYSLSTWSFNFRNLQTGHIFHYILIIFLSLIFLIIFSSEYLGFLIFYGILYLNIINVDLNDEDDF